MGTLNYIAPEAVRSGDFSARSDLYALGLVLYRSLTGQLPFDGVAADAAKLMAMRFNDPPPPLERHRQDVPAALAGLVNRLINQDPDIRPATAREVNQALEQITASPDRGPQRIGGRTQELIPVLQPGPPPRGQATSVLAGQVAPRPPSQPWVTIVLIVGVISTAMPLGVLYLRPYFSGSQASYRMVNHELRYSGQAVLFTYTTSRPCPTVVEVARGDGEPSRFPSVPTAPTTSHSVKITGLADGASLKVAALVPDGSRSIRLLARSPSLDNATVWAERTARAVQIVRAGEGAAGSTAAVLEAHTGEAIEHELRLGPLDPRTDYDMRSRLSTADGVTKSLRGVAIPSPLRELQSLAMDVRAQDYAAAMTKIEMSRANSSEKATLPPITRLLDRINYRSRAKLLSKQHTDIYGEGRLTVEERWNLYDSLGGLRHVDRYCQVYGLDLRTEVENLVSPDLRWSDAPLVSAPSTSITTRLAAGTILIPQDIDESLGLVKPDVQVPVAVPVTLLVPRSLDPGEAQISVTVSNLHSQALLIERAKDQRTLLLVPPARYAYTSTVLTLYHGWPREWSLPGKLTLNVRVVTMPGFYRNPKADAVKISLTNMKQSCLNLRDLSLALR
ncbi:MAG: hypothetical protein HY815_25995 [Candidatus Riflebacteria bacterium]|nr:hypothetical protein [Candidatus Riflebacteria bacterium]